MMILIFSLMKLKMRKKLQRREKLLRRTLIRRLKRVCFILEFLSLSLLCGLLVIELGMYIMHLEILLMFG